MTDLEPNLDAALADLARRSQVLVALDFDGVLAPIVPEPDTARALPRSAWAFHALAALDGVHVAVVSGRALADLRRLADPPPSASLIGSHGAQVADEHGHDIGAATTLDEASRDLLTRATAELHQISARYPGTFVEEKPAGAALHTRQITVREDAVTAAAAAAGGPGSWPGVRMTLGKEVVDLSVVDVNKGGALLQLREAIGLPPGSGGVVYIGDDVTDEDAFAVLDDASGDVTVKVGEGPTGAQHRIDDPGAVADVLLRVLDLLGTRPGHTDGHAR